MVVFIDVHDRYIELSFHMVQKCMYSWFMLCVCVYMYSSINIYSYIYMFVCVYSMLFFSIHEGCIYIIYSLRNIYMYMMLKKLFFFYFSLIFYHLISTRIEIIVQFCSSLM